MKVAVSSTGKTLQSSVSPAFGRCPFFIFVEIENKKIKSFKAVDNVSAMQAGGAGISAAQRVAEENVEAVITGNIGPRASSVLSQLGIKILSASGSVEDAVKLFIEGKLKESVVGPAHRMGRGRRFGWR